MKAIDKIVNAIKQMGYEPVIKINERRINEWSIRIVLEQDNVWINGFGEPMKWDRVLSVQHDRIGYLVCESVGYSMSHRLCGTGKADEVIRVLTDRLKGE